jgi:hypothetical protein
MARASHGFVFAEIEPDKHRLPRRESVFQGLKPLFEPPNLRAHCSVALRSWPAGGACNGSSSAFKSVLDPVKLLCLEARSHDPEPVADAGAGPSVYGSMV